jgi:hypothetical protein
MPAHDAAPLVAWLAALERLGPGHVLIALGHLAVVALAGLAVGAARDAAGSPRGWWLLATLHGALALDTLLQLHVPWVQWLRRTALAAGHYDARRGWQLLALYVGVALALEALVRIRARLREDWPALAPLVAGSALLVTLAALRWPSFHGSDQLLALRLAGLSLARGLELLGLALCIGTLLRWLQRH